MGSANEADSVTRHPWVSYALIGVLLLGSVGMLLSGPSDLERASQSPEMQELVRAFERNPEVEVSGQLARFIGREQMAELRAFHDQRRKQGGVAVLSQRMLEKTQARFDEAQRRAFDSLHDLPSWRFGLVDGDTPLVNTYTHLMVNDGWAALLVSMLFLVLAAITVEGAWGSLLFGGLCLLLPIVTRLVYLTVYGDQGIPWTGMSGLVAGLLGAYLVRSFGGFTIPGWLVLPVWVVAEYLFARDLPIDEFDATPLVVHAACFGFGAAAAGIVWGLGLEGRIGERERDTSELLSNDVLEQALALRDAGDDDGAFEMLAEELGRNPGNHDAGVALWQLASGTDRASRAMPLLVGVVRDALRRGRRDEACSLWVGMTAQGEPRAEGTLLVRIGEALLSKEEQEPALHAFELAVSGPKPLSSVLAQRIVRSAKDRDPGLAARAAAIALADDQLALADRNAMQVIVDAAPPGTAPARPAAAPARPADVSQPAPPAAAAAPPLEDLSQVAPPAAATASPLEDLSQPAPPAAAAAPPLPDLSQPAPPAAAAGEAAAEPDPFQDPHAIAVDALEEPPEGASLAGEDPNRWNQPGLVEGLSEEDLSRSQGSDWSGLQDDEDVTDPVTVEAAGGGAEVSETTERLEPEAAAAPDEGESAPASDAAGDLDLGDVALDADLQPSRRPLRALAAVPVSLDDEGLTIEVQGGSKSQLPYERIEAVSAAAVRGLAEKPVLVVDVVLNWLDVPDQPLKVIRLRSDGFDPRAVVPGCSSALEALRKLLEQLLTRSGGTPLPSREAALGQPFASFPDLETYDRDVLMAG